MKKFLSVLLAAVMALGCFAVGAFAEEAPEAPELTASGFYVGQRLEAGDKITSAYDKCESLIVKYYVGVEDRDNVTSAMQATYASENFKGVVSFRDNIASFTSGELYKGVYYIRGLGDTVSEMEIENGKYVTGFEVDPDEDDDVVPEFKIDYKHSKTTLIQYTSLVAWEITSVKDYNTSLALELKAVYETREPNGFESFLESLYNIWLDYLDWVGDILIKVLPALVEISAKMLGKK